MPSRNSVKLLEPDSYYHLYNRGASKQPIFKDSQDKKYFLGLLDRYLNQNNKSLNGSGVGYPKYQNQIELLCYCLMDNHYHLLVYVGDKPQSLSKFVSSVMTAYSMYFNLRYTHQGTIFQGVYKAAKITNDSYLLHITRYIHLNPKNYTKYVFSSYRAYIDQTVKYNWLKPQKILSLFNGDYELFVKDHADHKRWENLVLGELADS